ncbi:MAG TPA: hypothetical protein VES03_01360 [Motilibacterales bacterium]|nr:hypothetical protein [Motilibacterales bacterium]
MGSTCFMAAFLTWSLRRWVVAAAVAGGTYLFFGLSTAVLANPVFGRSVPPTPWAPEVLIVTAILSGLLTATYVRNDGPAPIRLEAVEAAMDTPASSRTARAGAAGSLLAYLAIGCPVCNKIALLLLGTSGALNLYAPIQPYLGAIGIALMSLALIIRLRGEVSCATVDMWRAGSRERSANRPAERSRGPLTTQDILAGLPSGPAGTAPAAAVEADDVDPATS